MNSKTESMVPGAEPFFRISEAAIRKRQFNTALGIVLGVALCVIALQGNAADSQRYNATLLVSIVGFVIIFCLYNLLAHIRYIVNSRKHHLEIGEDCITFVTGTNESVLTLSDVALVEQQSRLREGPSLMMRLKNKRIVRLVGYERQEALNALVTQRIARIQVSVPPGE